MIHILIADQQTLMRTGMRRLLSDEPDLSVVAEAGRIEQVLATIRIGKVDVLLMDVNLPGIDSVEATRRLLRLNEELKIIVLGAHASGPYPVHLFKAGIAGYLTKASSSDEMLVCIRKVFRGQRHVSADVAQTLLLDHMHDGDAPLGCLTQRELSVLVLLSQGHTYFSVFRPVSRMGGFPIITGVYCSILIYTVAHCLSKMFSQSLAETSFAQYHRHKTEGAQASQHSLH